MKNVFWFLHKPANERESAVFDKAYRNSLHLLWLSLAFLTIAFATLGNLKISSNWLAGILFLLLVTSYSAGWVTLKDEDLTYASATTIPLPRPANYLSKILVILALGFIMSYAAPAMYFSILIIVTVFIAAVLSVWSWRVTTSLPTYIRVPISLFLPAFGIAFAYHRNRQTSMRVFLGLVYMMTHLIAIMALIVSIRIFVVEPLVIATNTFEPELVSGQRVLINKVEQHFQPGDFVLIKGTNGRKLVAKVIDVQATEARVQTSVGEMTVMPDQIIGIVIRN